MAISGQIKSTNLTNATTSADYGVAPDRRRLYNFSDRIAELAPEESPFFVYLSKTAKLPTDDSLFRYLEDRTKIQQQRQPLAFAQIFRFHYCEVNH